MHARETGSSQIEGQKLDWRGGNLVLITAHSKCYLKTASTSWLLCLPNPRKTSSRSLLEFKSLRMSWEKTFVGRQEVETLLHEGFLAFSIDAVVGMAYDRVRCRGTNNPCSWSVRLCEPNRVSSVWAGWWGNGNVWWQTSGMALASPQRHSQTFWGRSSASRGSPALQSHSETSQTPPKSWPTHLLMLFLFQVLTLQSETYGLVLKLPGDFQSNHWNNTVIKNGGTVRHTALLTNRAGDRKSPAW